MRHASPHRGVAAIGDSLTTGTRASWFAHATRLGRVPSAGNYAVAGACAVETLEQLPRALSARPAVVVILAGVNDLLAGRDPDLSVFATFAERSREATATPVIALLPGAPGSAVEPFNGRLRTVAYDLRVPLIAFPLYGSPRMSRDGIHPTVLASLRMAACAVPVLRRCLR